VTLKFVKLDKTQLAAIATVAAGFTALLSLFNIGGRFFWASLFDKLGRTCHRSWRADVFQRASAVQLPAASCCLLVLSV
jgi:hypothetical protein